MNLIYITIDLKTMSYTSNDSIDTVVSMDIDFDYRYSINDVEKLSSFPIPNIIIKNLTISTNLKYNGIYNTYGLPLYDVVYNL